MQLLQLLQHALYLFVQEKVVLCVRKMSYGGGFFPISGTFPFVVVIFHLPILLHHTTFINTRSRVGVDGAHDA